MTQEFFPGSSRPITSVRQMLSEVENTEDRWDKNPKVLTVKGEPMEFFTIGQLGEALGGRKAVTIRKWERLGIIPKPTFRKPSDDPRGQRRLYTRAQVEGLVKIAQEEGILALPSPSVTKTEFTAKAIQLFRRLAEEFA